jgi:hypothetical protein
MAAQLCGRLPKNRCREPRGAPSASERSLTQKSPRPRAPDLGADIADREIMGDRANHVKRFVL